jgi:type I restriction enzyme S subunit
LSELAVGSGNELPDSWTTAAFEDVAALSPKMSVTDVDATDLVHFVPMAAVAENFGGIDVSQMRPYGDVRKGYTTFSEGDVLFAKITPCMENGKGALVPHLPNKHAFGSTEFHVLRPEGAVQPKWLAHYLSQPDFRRVARQNMAGTAGQLRVPTKWLANAGIPVPPLAEQTRIVEKLEELLSDLDAGVAELKAAQHKLVQYRQSLLKAAVEGALTADWRATALSRAPAPQPLSREGRGLESGADLLQRILTERRARWEARQLTKFAEQGKTPPQDWKSKYQEPIAPDTADLPVLPDGWVWASVDQLSKEQRYGSSSKTNEDSSGVPVLRMGNIQDGELDLSRLKYLPQDHDEFPSLFLDDGDILFNRTNSPELVGKSAVYRSQVVPCSYASYLISVKLSPFCSPELVAAYINSGYGRSWVKSVVTQQVGQANVNGTKLAALAVPLPPLAEQVEIVRILMEQRLAAFNQETMVEHSLKQSTAQRKNILKAAYAGQLVPQDPNDEPASVLLERIRAARAGAASVRTRNRAGSNPAPVVSSPPDPGGRKSRAAP